MQKGSDKTQGVQDVAQVSGLCHWLEVGVIYSGEDMGGGLEAGEQRSSLMQGSEQIREGWRMDLKKQWEDIQGKFVKYEVAEDM